MLEAALALLVERGFAATRMEDVAQRAGVSKGTVYLYWSSKEELLQAVIQRYLGGSLAQGAVAIQAHTGSTAELMRTVYVDWWIQVLESPASGVFKLMLAEARNFPEIAQFYRREVVESGRALIASVLQRGIESGEFRPVDVEAAVFSLMLSMVMLCVHKHSVGVCAPIQGLQDGPRLIRAHVDLILQGLLQRPPEATSKIA